MWRPLQQTELPKHLYAEQKGVKKGVEHRILGSALSQWRSPRFDGATREAEWCDGDDGISEVEEDGNAELAGVMPNFLLLLLLIKGGCHFEL